MGSLPLWKERPQPELVEGLIRDSQPAKHAWPENDISSNWEASPSFGIGTTESFATDFAAARSGEQPSEADISTAKMTSAGMFQRLLALGFSEGNVSNAARSVGRSASFGALGGLACVACGRVEATQAVPPRGVGRARGGSEEGTRGLWGRSSRRVSWLVCWCCEQLQGGDGERVQPARGKGSRGRRRGHRHRAFAWSGDAQKLSSHDSFGKDVAKYSKLGQNERFLLHWVGLGTL
jgi:hypothetical protein